MSVDASLALMVAVGVGSATAALLVSKFLSSSGETPKDDAIDFEEDEPVKKGAAVEKKKKKKTGKKLKKGKKTAATKSEEEPVAADDDDDEEEDGDYFIPAAVPKKKKKKKKSSSSDAEETTDEEPAPVVVAAPAPSPVPAPAPAPAPAPVAVAEEPVVTEKKKKKKKKKKAKVVEASLDPIDSELSSSGITEDERTPTSSAVTSTPVEDNWTVQRKRGKSKATPETDQYDFSAEGGGLPEVSTVDATVKIAESIELGNCTAVVIGRGGDTVRSIQEESGATVDVQKAPINVAKVSGTKEQVAHALGLINKILEEQDKIKSIEIALGEKGVGAVIGRGGSNIRIISENSGAKLDVKKDTMSVVITGSLAEVEAARELVAQALAGPIQDKNAVYQTVELGKQGIYCIIGRGGRTIRGIQDQTGARMDIEKGSTYVTISGLPDQVSAAVTLVTNLLASSQHTVLVDIGQMVGAVMGKGGERIRSIQETTGARLDIEKDHVDLGAFVRITGSLESIAAARSQVEAVLAEPAQIRLDPGQVIEKLDVGKAVGSVIGKGGMTIRSLQESTGARIDIPRSSSVCNVIGTQEQVDAAVAAITELVKRNAEFTQKAEAQRAARLAEAAAAVQTVSAPTDSWAGLDDAPGNAPW